MVGKRWVNFIVIFQFSRVNCAVLILTIHSPSSEINSSPFILMFYRYYIPLLIIIATLLMPEAKWIWNLRENKIPGVAVDVFHTGTFCFFSARLKFPGRERQGGSLMWGLITAHLSGSVYSGLDETFWTSGLLFSVCSLHSITQESSPGGGSPCALLKVTVVAAQHLWFWGCCRVYADAPVCVPCFVSLRLYSDTDTLKQQRGVCVVKTGPWVMHSTQMLKLILIMQLTSAGEGRTSFPSFWT